MVLPNYSRVRLQSNQYSNEGVSEGDIGYIIEIYDEGTDNPEFEVEFYRSDGTTIAMLVVKREEIELAEEEE